MSLENKNSTDICTSHAKYKESLSKILGDEWPNRPLETCTHSLDELIPKLLANKFCTLERIRSILSECKVAIQKFEENNPKGWDIPYPAALVMELSMRLSDDDFFNTKLTVLDNGDLPKLLESYRKYRSSEKGELNNN
jgi:hypothetical protein